MKIVFNLINVGLGNNGGSSTLVQSANTLQDLGADVIIIDSSKSNYTWNKIKVPFRRVSDVNDIDGDVIIATGINSVSSTNKSKIKNKFNFLRGWEIWNHPEDKFVKILKESPTKKIVNSIGLQSKLKKFGIDSKIIMPGYNFDEIYPINIRKKNEKIVLGGLYNQGVKRSKKRTSWIFESYKILKQTYKIELYMFGSDGVPSNHLDKYLKNPNMKDKNELYNKVNIWLSTSELEGLHITPAEAMLTGCCVVGNNSELCGTKDYLIDGETGLVSLNNFDSFVEKIKTLIEDKNLRKKLGKQGRKKILSLGNRKDNMLRMIDLLKEWR